MILQGIRHTGTFPDVYATSRNHLVISLRVSRREAESCQLIYFSRDWPEDTHSIHMEFRYRDGLYDYYKADVHLRKVARYQKYYFKIRGKTGETVYLTATGIYEEPPERGFYEYLYANENDILKIPDWVKGQIYYQIFPERYATSANHGKEGLEPWGNPPTRENYMGGDLKGITDHLPHIKKLGAEGIYLNPIFAADFNHKYATTDYKQIDPQFGTDADFKELVDTAHNLGLKIVLDGVFNHTGTSFFAFKDILANGEKSLYKDWYYITRYPVEITADHYECVGAYPYMPKLKSGSPEVRAYIISVMEYWIDTFHIDGWRLDVADEVDPEVWNEARVRLKAKYPEILLLGETWGGGYQLMNGMRMDSMMNYLFRDATLEFLADESIDADTYSNRMQAMLARYPEEMDQAMYLALDSHDTERTLFRCGGSVSRMKLAIVVQMLFDGAPAIYYGDEIGLTGDNDPDCRRCMNWTVEEWNVELLEHYKFLAALRNNIPCIKTGKFLVNVVEGRVFGFIRSDDEDEVSVLINASDTEQKVDIPVLANKTYHELTKDQDFHADILKKGTYCNQDVIPYKGHIETSLGAKEVRIFRRRTHEQEKNTGNCTRNNA